ncbi:hypothetical protein LLG96_11800 [bacterium]|nr:hypothetical protein [bacterium]
MNVFFLHRDPVMCARYHCDRHVVKMQLEDAQLLSVAVRKCGIDAGYRLTHGNHPAVVWTQASIGHWLWLRSLAFELEKEWRFRYSHPEEKTHKSVDVVRQLPVPPLPERGWTDPPPIMDGKYITGGDSIASYRTLYREDKVRFATWKRRPAPGFMKGASVRQTAEKL